MAKSAKGATKPTEYQAGDVVTIWYERDRVDEPDQILEVVRCNQRTVALSDGKEWPVRAGNIRRTQPGDEDRIVQCKARAEIGTIERGELDNEAVLKLLPIVRDLRARAERRRKVITSAIRVALIDGPMSRSDLHTAARRFGACPYDEMQDYIHKAGAHEHDSSKHHGRVYARTSTNADRFDAVLMGVFLAKMTPTKRVLLKALSAEYGITMDEAEIQIKAPLERIGAIMMWGLKMGRGAKWQLQPCDT